MKLNRRELATVLAALRLWQNGYREELESISTDDFLFSALSHDEIDELCERINV